MLNDSDAPHTHFPPKHLAPTAWFLRQVNRHWQLPRTLKIQAVHVDAHPALLKHVRAGDAVMLTPNHPTHADAPILIEACRQLGIRPRTMAAYDVFLRSRLTQWVMQRLNCFSVDRNASDKRALDLALATLTDSPWPLVVFPEGNVYLENDRVGPFQEGAAFLALRAHKQLTKNQNAEAADAGKPNKQAQPRRVVIVPVAIKASHLHDDRPLWQATLQQLARLAQTDLPDAPIAEQLQTVGRALLNRNLALRNHPAVPDDLPLPQAIQAAVLELLPPMEQALGLAPKADAPKAEAPLADRLTQCRRQLHAMLVDSDQVADHRAAERWVDQALLAKRLLGYSGDYVAESPTLDRVAETIEKLHEDVHDQAMPAQADRVAFVRFGQPIDIGQWLQTETATKPHAKSLTAAIEAQVQSLLSPAPTPAPGSVASADHVASGDLGPDGLFANRSGTAGSQPW